MFTLDQARARRLKFITSDSDGDGGGSQTPAGTVAALESLDAAADDETDRDAESDDDDVDGAEQLGDAGKQALDRMKERLRSERTRRLAAEQALTESSGADDTAKVERAALKKANDRIVRAEVRAAAAGKLAEPADALRFLDLTSFEVDDDGQVDDDEITDAIADLIARKPYLAAQGGPRSPRPDPAQGGSGRGPATAADRFAAQMTKLGL